MRTHFSKNEEEVSNEVVDLNKIVADMQKMVRRLINEDIRIDIDLSPLNNFYKLGFWPVK